MPPKLDLTKDRSESNGDEDNNDGVQFNRYNLALMPTRVIDGKSVKLTGLGNKIDTEYWLHKSNFNRALDVCPRRVLKMSNDVSS